MTTILDREEALKFDDLACFEFFDVAPLQADVTEESGVEDTRRYLEDTITSLGTVDESEVNDADDDDKDGTRKGSRIQA